MSYDAIVLAGGRSSRLGGQPKARLAIGGRTLLGSTLEAVRDARTVVVVGEPDPRLRGVRTVREEPPFSGPAAAIAAGIRALSPVHASEARETGAEEGSAIARADSAIGGRAPASEFVVVLACDMPAIGSVVPVLVAGIESEGNRSHRVDGARGVDGTPGAGGAHSFGGLRAADGRNVIDGGRTPAPAGAPVDGLLVDDGGRPPARPGAPVDGLLAVDGDRVQFLAAIYRRDALERAVSAHAEDGSLRDLSVRALVSTLRLDTVRVPDGGTRDVDTWSDAVSLGVDGASASGLDAVGRTGPEHDPRAVPGGGSAADREAGRGGAGAAPAPATTDRGGNR